MKKIFCLLLLSVIFFSSSDAQNRENPWAVGASFTGLSYKNAQDRKYFNFTGMTGGPSIFFGRYLNPSFNLRLAYTYGKVFYPQDEGYPNAISDLYRSRELHDAALILDYKLTNGYIFGEESWFVPYIFAGVGGNSINDDFNFVVPAGIGFDFHLTPYLTYHIRGSYKFVVDNSYNYTQLETGLNFNFGKEVTGKIKDNDNDGVPNKDDACPNEIGLLELDGCPDNDGDGIADKDDECPGEAGEAEFNGCPPPDSDGDNVPDRKDKCPFTPGLVATMGCPDADGDGVIDGEDNCPKAFGPAENKGCPLPDADGDGIPDEEDACPDEKGVRSNNGCPGTDDGVVKMAFDDLRFKEGSAVIEESSFESLNRLGDMMKKNPSYKLRIEGHTDNQGDPAANVNLSQKRARAVRDYLIYEKDIDPTRFQVIGYGGNQPIMDNATEEGRAKNRRVELKIYEK